MVLEAGIIRRVSEGGVDFNVICKKFGGDSVMEWVSDVIYEEDEKNGAEDTALWDAAGDWTMIRKTVANSDYLSAVSEEGLDPV